MGRRRPWPPHLQAEREPMTPKQLELIPTDLLNPHRSTDRLLSWLHARGWQMTLLELDTERRRRNNTTDHRATPGAGNRKA